MVEIDRSLMALAQALTAANPHRMGKVLAKIEAAAAAIRQAQQSKTAAAMWEAWRNFSDFRSGIWSDLSEISHKEKTPATESDGWKIADAPRVGRSNF